MARRAFCGIKKWWVFENRNLRFWNLDFPKLTISIFENWTFRVLLLLQKIQKLVEVSLMLSLVRKWGVHTDRHTDTQTHAHHQFWGSSTQKALRAITFIREKVRNPLGPWETEFSKWPKMMKKCQNHFGFFPPAQYTLGVYKNRWEKSQGAKCWAAPQNNCQNVQLQPLFWRAPHVSSRPARCIECLDTCDHCFKLRKF